MPSTYTALGFEKQAAGENLNTWGAPHLNNTIDRINYAIAGYVAIAVTGDTVLTSSNSSTSQADFQGRNSLLKFTGTAGAATITVPSTPMTWLLWNATNGALTITTGSGLTVVMDPDDKLTVWCDGTNVQQPGYAGLSIKAYADQLAFTANAGNLPAQLGNAGKFVTTNGTVASWTAIASTNLSDYATAILGVQVALAVAL